MNKTLQKRISQLEMMMGLQRDCISPSETNNDYMFGMLNGMIFSHSVIVGINPTYEKNNRRRRTNNKIRYKGKK